MRDRLKRFVRPGFAMEAWTVGMEQMREDVVSLQCDC